MANTFERCYLVKKDWRGKKVINEIELTDDEINLLCDLDCYMTKYRAMNDLDEYDELLESVMYKMLECINKEPEVK